MALRPDIGMDLWDEITGEGKKTSHWLLFERGYEYSEKDLGEIIDAASHGESELNPLYVGAWGEGARPVLDAPLNMFRGDYSNIVVQGVELAGSGLIIGAENVLIDDATLTHNETFAVQESESFSIRYTAIYDVYTEDPANGRDWMDEHGDRVQGIFVRGTEHLLLEDLFIDHVGWEDGYNPDLRVDDGQAPNIYSQNIYLADTNRDVTLRDTISMRAAAYGAQIRSGGFVEDNAFIDNNSGFNLIGGDYLGKGPVGEYSLAHGNLVTSAGYRDTDQGNEGALSEGIYNVGRMTSLVDNIVAHLADPDSDELDYKYWVHDAVDSRHAAYYDDTAIYNWFGARFLDYGVNPKSADRGLEDADMAALDDVTIQNYTAALLDRDEAAIADLADYLRAQHEGEVGGDVTADDIIAFFEDPFGVAEGERTGAATLRFVPDDRGEGTRWDNALNWDTEDKPRDGDSIDLAGNWVQHDGTIAIEDLEFGDGGTLDVTQGRLTVEGALSTSGAGGTLSVAEAGQAWIEDYDDAGLEIDVSGGRFANTGDFAGRFALTARDGQVLLGVDDATMRLEAGSTLSIEGSGADVGFDGEAGGVSVVDLDGGTLSMTADKNGVSTIEEFRSGAMGDSPNVLSGFDMGEGTLLLDVTALSGDGEEVLLEVDEMVGMFDEINVVGLGDRTAQLIFDYDTDTVTMKLLQGGGGAVEILTEGDMGDAAAIDPLWQALTAGQGVYEEMDETPRVNGEDLDEEDILAA
ncbi:MAG: hypothetical protein ACFCGT_26250 [Sandaracinaceae bacterium]